MEQIIHGKPLEEWKEMYPLFARILATNEVFWKNPNCRPFADVSYNLPFSERDVLEAEARLRRFAPFFATAFPETNGIIESPLIEIEQAQQAMEAMFLTPIVGKMWLKCDSHLPIAGSVKARGGVYEVLVRAEQLALAHGLLSLKDNYSVFASESFRQFFSQFSLTVGSTGNLGLSIGIIGAKLGFRVVVHMSGDAKQWKKELLRKHGVHVIEHRADYSAAVEQGRKEAAQEPNNYFVDDENSAHLFLGYAVAALRLKKQLEEKEIVVDREHPLFVYLPCGVGGAPGGITFGLKLLFGDAVHCFFAEPTHAPCMLLGMMTGLHDQISVQDFGIDNQTEADGLAVGRPSRFVGKTVEQLVSGIYTVDDQTLSRLLALMYDNERLSLEPSALAGVYGPIALFPHSHHQAENITEAIHLCWATGGSLVPEQEWKKYYERGKQSMKE
ncbi:D-serine ammonia-lyase [Anoxybacteroides amylolyticum]|uniref:Probable D-serine dehydratase n=1 Tax=Anoxybacteroides amylolyticum TaxID=294699 RepID=A0A160F798_9BACL|nr:D-serine ammonia-lyase [Anoxybacillus amylolyticus]ANB61903.1 D-serine ammonia-lyase [Anoxybacillus amylolyticus]